MANRAFMNRRRSSRTPVTLEASIVTMSDYQYFDVLNVSATGAKVKGPSLPPLGKTALLRLEDFQTLCRVVWVKEGECGIRFDELIPPRVLDVIAQRGERAQVGMIVTDEPESDVFG